jgi:hypothetical protein
MILDKIDLLKIRKWITIEGEKKISVIIRLVLIEKTSVLKIKIISISHLGS